MNNEKEQSVTAAAEEEKTEGAALTEAVKEAEETSAAEAPSDGSSSKKAKKAKKKKSKRSLFWKIPLIVLASLLAIVIVYVSYVFISYSRIDDNQPVEVLGTAQVSAVKTGKEYTAVTYNIGFGAYTPDFTFFMDGGTQSWANSKDSVIDCINGDIALLKELGADFPILQEVDTDSTRSYHVDQAQMFRDAFGGYSSTFAVNYHSAFLFWPIYQPHGASNSGLLTLSDAQITSSLRRSLPISTGLKKILDLDRCYSINRIPAENGRELIIFNVHMSAYGTDAEIQKGQLTMLFADMQKEYEKGNYVVCGGDFNHDIPGNSKEIFNGTVDEKYAWAAPFPDEMIPAHFRKVTEYASGVTVPSCRNCDKPAGPDCFTVTTDGFIVSDNVEVTYIDVIDNRFLYSDHNPVKMTFRLK